MVNVFLNLFIPVTAGYVLHRLGLIGHDFQPRANRFLMRFFSPVVVALSFWGLEFKDARLLYLPLIGALITLLSFFPGLLVGTWLKLSRRQLASFISAAMFTNLGFYGGYIAFERFGQLGYNLVALYCVFFSPVYYTVGFIICEHFSSDDPDPNWTKRLILLFKRDIVFRSLAGIVIGFILGQWGPPRPEFLGQLVNYLIPFLTWVYLFLAGCALRIGRMRHHLGTSAWLSLVKFTFPLVITWGCVQLMGFGGAEFDIACKVLYLEAICPVGISVLVLPSLFKIDGDLANTAWLFTHLAAFFLILPFYYLLF